MNILIEFLYSVRTLRHWDIMPFQNVLLTNQVGTEIHIVRLSKLCSSYSASVLLRVNSGCISPVVIQCLAIWRSTTLLVSFTFVKKKVNPKWMRIPSAKYYYGAESIWLIADRNDNCLAVIWHVDITLRWCPIQKIHKMTLRIHATDVWKEFWYLDGIKCVRKNYS